MIFYTARARRNHSVISMTFADAFVNYNLYDSDNTSVDIWNLYVVI